MENTVKVHKMLDTILKIASIITSITGTIIRVIDMLQRRKIKHQKSNRDSTK